MLPLVLVALPTTTTYSSTTAAPTTGAPTAYQSCLVITGVMDGPLSGQPKVAELFTLCEVTDVGEYGIARVANGKGSGSETSKPAPAMVPSCSACTSDAVSTTSPRAMLIKNAVSLQARK